MTFPQHNPRRRALFGVLLLLTACEAARAAEPVDFNRDILPILADNCFQCHGPDAAARKAELRLDTQQGAFRQTNPIIVPGKSAESELVVRLRSSDPNEVMPPPASKKTLTAAQIELFARWVDGGAAWGGHWAYRAPERPPFPVVTKTDWPRNEIDHFILARLEREGLAPSPEAPRETLLRRVTLDLVGLPPTLEELDAFLADDAPGAYERVVDRLLASPRYGERMCWDWLDAARYADTNGFQGDPVRTMYPWRDWVIKAYNDNMPYDQFTIEQIAGDLLTGATLPQKIATAFNRNHMYNGEGGRIPEETRIENVFDRLETTGTVWLGITIGCARCHDHKYDPFTRKEYYEFFAFFNNTSESGGGAGSFRTGHVAPELELPTAEQQAKRTELGQLNQQRTQQAVEREKELRADFSKWEAQALAELAKPEGTKLPPRIIELLKKEKRTEQETKELQDLALTQDAKLMQIRKERDESKRAYDDVNASIVRVMVMDDLAQPRQTFMLTKGAYNQPGEVVTAGVPASLLPALPKGQPVNRLALAKWLVDPANPLTARVTVNRAWQMFFGTGLVKTAEDFGVQGEKPSHPELLDWLATEFIRTGWNVKALHREIVTSATYRQSSKTSPALLERDPENRLLARGARFRLPSYTIRDQALAVSGLFVDRSGGAPVKPYQPAGIWEEATFGTKKYDQDHGEALYRRSLYTFWRRIVGPTMFFDTASRQTCTVRTARTNTPLQALSTLNDVTYVEASRALAQRLLELPDQSPAQRLELGYRLTTSRRPTPVESTLLLSRLERLKQHFTADPAATAALLKVGESPRDEKVSPADHAAWTAICSVLLNLDETLTKP